MVSLDDAVAFFRAGEYGPAERSCRELLAAQPENADALHLLGVVVYQAGKPVEAIEYLQKAVQLLPGSAEASGNLGLAYHAAGDFAASAFWHRRALGLNPDAANACNNLGMALLAQTKLGEAEAAFRRAIQLNPASGLAYCNLGGVLGERGESDEAAECFRRALELDPTYAPAHSNLGRLLCSQSKLDEAEAACRQAIELRPDFAEAHVHLGKVLFERGDARAAFGHYQRAIGLKPDYPLARFIQSTILLRWGEFERGFAGYEWRWKCALSPRAFAQPAWAGESLQGKTILLHAEQGLGDTIQFVRYAALVKQSAAVVILECQSELAGLLRSADGIDVLVVRGDPLPAFDVHLPLMSLPRVLRTTLESVPAKVPYVRPPADRASAWRTRLAADRKFKIGIVWRGNRQYRRDANRSIPPSCFAALAEISGLSLYGLQKDAAAGETDELSREFSIVDLREQIRDFGDTAAIISQLDLVVSCDSAPAHLAGALGRPVWVALPLVADWRWLLGREDSPWYPSMRLFRQGERGDWRSVFHNMQAALVRLLQDRGDRA